MDLFTVVAKLRLDSGDFEKNLRKMDHERKGFADSLAKSFDKVKKIAVAIGSAFAVKKVADGLWSVANAAAQAGDKIDKQSQALGMSRKAYQEWEYILSQSGASIDSMGVSMKTLNSAILEGSDDTRQALSKLHLSTTELKHMSQEDAFKKVVEAFQKIPAGAQKSALAVQLFGRNGQELLPLLNSSAESIDELRRQANELGLVMSDEDVNASVAFGDALDTLKRTFTSFKYRFGAQILPALTNGMGKITDYAGKLRKAYDARGFAGVFDTLVSDVKNIKWPTWKDVRAAAETGWKNIKKGVAGLGKLVFGENEKGEVKWPTWDDVSEGAIKLWDNVKAAVADFGGLVFGKNEKGEVNWPDFSTAVEWAKTNIWDNIIVAGVKNFGGLIFGKKENGEVDWPTWQTVQDAANEKWEEIKAGAKTLKGLVFGDAESAGEIFTTIKNKWVELRNTIEQKAINIGTYFFGESNGEQVAGAIKAVLDALVAFGSGFTMYKAVTGIAKIGESLKSLFSFDLTGSKVAAILAAIATAFTLIVQNWDTIQPVLEQAVSWIESNVFEPISTFIQTYIVGPVQEVIDRVKQAAKDVASTLGIQLADGTLTKKQADQLNFSYRQSINEGGAEALNTSGWVNSFKNELEKAGFEEKQIEALTKAIVESDDPAWVEALINGLTDATEKAEALKAIIDEITSNSEAKTKGQAGPQRSRTVTGTAAEEQMQTAKPVEVEAKVNTSDVQEQLNDAEFLTQVGLNPDADPLLKFVNNLKLSTTIDIYPNYKGGSLPKSVPGLPGLTGGNDGAPKAIGDWNVPYDNYPALLHRNEMVLNATQARQYREGKGNGAGIDLDAMVNRIVAAVTTGIENANIDLDGEKITRNVNRRLAASVRAKRFA